MKIETMGKSRYALSCLMLRMTTTIGSQSDQAATITGWRGKHIVMLQCTIRYEPPNGHTVSHDMGSANSLSQ